jgi:YD repeat-containing protein
MNRPARPAAGRALFQPGPFPALLSWTLCLLLSAPLARAEEGGQAGPSDAGNAGSALYSSDGRLLRFESPDGSSASGELRAGADSIMWTQEGGRLTLRYYNAEGRLVRVERFEERELSFKETRSWAGSMVQGITREDLRKKTLVRQRYNEEGLLTLEEAYDGERLRYTESRGYDDEGRLLSIAREENLAGRVTAFLIERAYAEDGRLAAERRYKDALPELFTLWSAAGEFVEEHYDKGLLFARVYYRADKKYREEIIQGGIVVRERVF